MYYPKPKNNPNKLLYFLIVSGLTFTLINFGVTLLVYFIASTDTFLMSLFSFDKFLIPRSSLSKS